MYDDVTYVYDDVTYVYDDVTYVYDDDVCVYATYTPIMFCKYVNRHECTWYDMEYNKNEKIKKQKIIKKNVNRHEYLWYDMVYIYV